MSKEAMKLALEALTATMSTHGFRDAIEEVQDKAITALKQALEQPEPETVECHTCKGLGRIYMGCGSWIHCDTCNTTGKATTPPKREPLTDEQMEQIHQQYGGNIKKIMRAIEAAHGIKGEQHGTR